MKTLTYSEAKALLEETRSAWIAEARAIAAKIAKRKGWVSANCVRDKCPPPKGIDGRAMGPVFNQPGVLRPTDRLMQSARQTSHRRKVVIHEYIGA